MCPSEAHYRLPRSANYRPRPADPAATIGCGLWNKGPPPPGPGATQCNPFQMFFSPTQTRLRHTSDRHVRQRARKHSTRRRSGRPRSGATATHRHCPRPADPARSTPCRCAQAGPAFGDGHIMARPEGGALASDQGASATQLLPAAPLHANWPRTVAARYGQAVPTPASGLCQASPTNHRRIGLPASCGACGDSEGYSARSITATAPCGERSPPSRG